jgi:serine/threonine-protein kinase PknK
MTASNESEPGFECEQARGAFRNIVRGFSVETWPEVPPTPRTKYRPPCSSSRPVDRERLFADLVLGRDRRLTLIHAPAGFGKTTLAAQWRERLLSTGAAVAWISVDQDDNNPVWFRAHLSEATAGYDVAANPLIVMVDDWYRVTDPRVLADLSARLTGPSTGLQWVITSRTRAGLPLEHLRAHDQLVEVDESRLRFTAAESEQLLQLNGVALAENDLADLLGTTQGWVAALQLAVLKLTEHRHSVDDYLAETVLNRLPTEVLDFLLQTAGPERVCADLVEALTGGRHGLAMLDQVAVAGLFLHQDDDPGWYRYHPLFAACLRRKLERDHPGEIGDLDRRAATWFAAHPQPGPLAPVEVVPVSDRELQILRLLDFGRSNQEIARTLFLSTNTIKWHLKMLFQKFEVTRRQECVAAARSAHLLN